MRLTTSTTFKHIFSEELRCIYIETMSFGIWLLNTLTLLTHAIQCNLVKKLKTSDLFKAVNSTCYQPRLLVLNLKILYIIEVKLINVLSIAFNTHLMVFFI